ncbi:MAG: hypothetical protein ACK5QX_08820, partial [bacterium]
VRPVTDTARKTRAVRSQVKRLWKDPSPGRPCRPVAPMTSKQRGPEPDGQVAGPLKPDRGRRSRTGSIAVVRSPAGTAAEVSWIIAICSIRSSGSVDNAFDRIERRQHAALRSLGAGHGQTLRDRAQGQGLHVVPGQHLALPRLARLNRIVRTSALDRIDGHGRAGRPVVAVTGPPIGEGALAVPHRADLALALCRDPVGPVGESQVHRVSVDHGSIPSIPDVCVTCGARVCARSRAPPRAYAGKLNFSVEGMEPFLFQMST